MARRATARRGGVPAASAAEGMRLLVREALHGLGHYGPKIDVDQKSGQEPYWYARIERFHIKCDLAGSWFVTSYWRFINDPVSNESVLQESSIGLNVSDDPYGICLTAGADSACIARYDFDLRDKNPLHLNVLQPRPLGDRLHWRLPVDTEPTSWSPEKVFRHLLVDSLGEMLERGWQKVA